MTVRDIEVSLASLEDNILANLGYREFVVAVGSTVISPSPQVVDKPKKNMSTAVFQSYLQALGNNGNPTNFFEVTISREIDENVIRKPNYWKLTRGNYKAECLPVEIVVSDSRYLVMLAVIKRVIE